MDVPRNEPAFIVDSLPQARAAADIFPYDRLTLVSPPKAAAYSGPRFFIELLRKIAAENKNITVTMWIDCDNDPGLALSAIRDGGKNIVMKGENAKSIDEIAQNAGVTLSAFSPRAIDCVSTGDIVGAYATWLDEKK